MKKALLVILSLVMMMGMFSTAVFAQESVSVMAVWGGQELDAFMKMVEPFEKATGIEVQYEGTRDLPTLVTTRLEAGNPPDIVALTGVGMMKQLAEEGDLVNLSNVLDMDRMNEEYDQTWIDLGTYDNDLYGMYISADIKSLVWYNPKEFEAKGYAVPGNWEELEALQEEMIANGDTPWAIGLESGAASGWPGTDWIEDIMLRTTSPEVYDQWVNHEIPWTDDRVRRAFEIFGNIAKDPEYTYGAPNAVLATNFGDAPNALFTDPPQAMMHRQASFITSFIKDNNPELVAGEDFDVFPFPAIDEEYGTPVLGAASMFGMMNDTPEAQAFMRYVSTAGAQSIFVSELGKLGVNKNINPNVYPDELTRQMAAMLKNAPTFRFDGSDSMPGAVGSGAFWEGILNYVSGEDLDNVLEYIESISDDTYNQ